MVWFLGVVIVLVLGGAVVVALGRGAAMRPVYDDRPDALVPADSPLTGTALRSVRFSVGLRGYRTDEVDALLAELAEQLDAADRPAHRTCAARPDDDADEDECR